MNTWQNPPGANHNGAAGFSFADGHSEIHKWSDRTTLQSIAPGGPKPAINIPPGKPSRDLAWVLEHATFPDTNAPAAAKP